MSRTCRVFALLAVVLLAGSVAWAQSSGNFSAAGSGTACLLNTSNGTLSGGAGCLATTNSPDCVMFSPTIKTSNGNGVTLLITPSAVTGLFTETKTLTATTSSTANIGIDVCVEAPAGSTVLPNSTITNTGAVPNMSCVIYDERFQQVSTNFFGLIAGCSTNASCEFELILSTLSAHSFNFIAQVPNGQNTIDVEWSIVNTNTAGNASVAACVGPADVTITQTKLFQNSGTLSF